MEFGVGSIEEIDYISQLVQKQYDKIDEEKIKKDKKIFDIKEYKYLRYLVFKYCFILNPNL